MMPLVSANIFRNNDLGLIILLNYPDCILFKIFPVNLSSL